MSIIWVCSRQQRWDAADQRKATELAREDNDTQVELSPRHLTDSLSSHLLSAKLCDTSEEAVPTAEAIVDECCKTERVNGRSDIIEPMTTQLMEYFHQLTEGKANDVARSVLGIGSNEDFQDDDSSTNNENERLVHDSDLGDDSSNDEDDGEYIGEGECELCEREIKLTRHHLIPKSTWSKMKKRIHSACDALSSGHEEKARVIMGGNLIDDLSQDVIENPSNSIAVRRFLSQTCNICRPCHSTVHQLHDEMELAERYNTVDKLLEDDQLLKFCKWASKQKAGKYSLSHR